MNRGGRGSILERLETADATGCELIEVPADFIKNPTEVRLTGLTFGSMLDPKAIAILYQTEPVPASCAVVLHTEPELTVPSQLRWYDRNWIGAFVGMQLALVEHNGAVPTAIEIHPGIAPNTVEDMIAGATALIDAFGERFGRAPLIMLENRTGQVVSDGHGVLALWRAIEKRGADFAQQFGVVLDIQQLFTQTAGRGRVPARFLDSLAVIPNEALRAFHIHYRHGVPSIDDPIPWRTVFARIRKIDDVLINPEIHHRKYISDAKEFCCRAMAGL